MTEKMENMWVNGHKKEELQLITLGTVMFAAGILGFVLCGVSLCLLPGHFRKQRERVLEEVKAKE